MKRLVSISFVTCFLCVFIYALFAQPFAGVLLVQPTAFPQKFYIDNSIGNDANFGTSPASAWQHWQYAGTNAIVKAAALLGPVSVLGNSAEVFQEGCPIVWSNSAASSNKPITLGAFGGATVVMSNTPASLSAIGIFESYASNIVFNGIQWIGNTNWVTNLTTGGVINSCGFVMSTVSPNRYGNIYFTNCLATGLREGFALLSDDASGAYNIGWTNCVSYNVAGGGVTVGGNQTVGVYDFTNVNVVGCTFSNIYADHYYVNGEGVSLIQVYGGYVASNLDHDNGQNATNGAAGPTGMIAFHSRNIIFDSNEVYNVSANPNGIDGEGMDLDVQTAGCIIERCFCHDNDGPGLYIFGCYSNNIIRNNITCHNGRNGNTGSQLAAECCVASTGSQGIQIYNNDFLATRIFTGGGVVVRYVALQNKSALTGTNYVLNNILFSVNSNALQWVGANTAFNGNDYYSPVSTPIGISWNGTQYTGLPAFVTAGQESLGFGKSVNPDFAAPWTGFDSFYAQFGAWPSAITGNPNGMTNWLLTTNRSQLTNAVDMNNFYGLANGGNDFNGNTIPNTNFCIGAVNKSAVPGLTNDFNGLTAWWIMLEAGGTHLYDYTGNGNTATLTGAPVFNSSGWITFKQSSSQKAQIPANAALSTTPITITAWVRMTNAGVGLFQTITGGTTGAPQLFTAPTSGTGLISLSQDGGSVIGTSTQQIAYGLGTWTHVAATYDGTTWNIYTNAANVGTGSSALTFTAGATLSLAYDRQAVANYFNGDMRLVSWYNRVLSAAEITNIYQLGLISGANNIVGQ